MKRQVDKTGGKLWFNDNLIDGFQDQLYKAVESQYKPFGSCIISGCEVSGSNIAEGIVYLDGKIMPFAGASGVTFPKYLKSQMTPVTAAYDDGHSDTTEEIYEAIISSTIPSGEYITVSAQGGKTFRQAFQDANNRMVSDAKINEWNASRGNAVSDVRGGVAGTWDTLKKLYDWAVNLFNTKIDKTSLNNSISFDDSTVPATSRAVKNAKENARTNAVSDVRGGVGSSWDTLKKVYDYFKNYYHSGNANKSDIDWLSRNFRAAGYIEALYGLKINNPDTSRFITGNTAGVPKWYVGNGTSFGGIDDDLFLYSYLGTVKLYDKGRKRLETVDEGIAVIGTATVDDIIIR